MSNYNYQYKKYYEDIRNKNFQKTRSPIYTSSSFENVYSSEKNKKENKSFFSSMVNIFIYQLVVVTFMLFAVFYFKYSPEQQKNYEEIKAVMSDTTYTIKEDSIKTSDFSQIINKINNYIKLNLTDKKTNL